jgi:hypothetical protein
VSSASSSSRAATASSVMSISSSFWIGAIAWSSRFGTPPSQKKLLLHPRLISAGALRFPTRPSTPSLTRFGSAKAADWRWQLPQLTSSVRESRVSKNRRFPSAARSRVSSLSEGAASGGKSAGTSSHGGSEACGDRDDSPLQPRVATKSAAPARARAVMAKGPAYLPQRSVRRPRDPRSCASRPRDRRRTPSRA